MSTAASQLASKALGKAFSIGGAMNAAFTYSDYSDARDNGNGVISSALLAAGNYTLFNMLGTWGTLGMQFIPAIGGAAVSAYNGMQGLTRSIESQSRNNAKPFGNSTFVDTQQTYTMRQAGMNLARQSKYSVQQAMLGDEARMVSR